MVLDNFNGNICGIYNALDGLDGFCCYKEYVTCLFV